MVGSSLLLWNKSERTDTRFSFGWQLQRQLENAWQIDGENIQVRRNHLWWNVLKVCKNVVTKKRVDRKIFPWISGLKYRNAWSYKEWQQVKICVSLNDNELRRCKFFVPVLQGLHWIVHNKQIINQKPMLKYRLPEQNIQHLFRTTNQIRFHGIHQIIKWLIK